MGIQVPLDSIDDFYIWLESVRENFYSEKDLEKILNEIKTGLTVKDQSEVVHGNLTLSEAQIFQGSLKIEGDLILPGDQEMLIVAGDLIVDKDIVSLGFDYSLIFVGGNIRCKNLATNGELVVLNNLIVSNTLLAIGNNYSSVGNEIHTKLMCLTDDRADFFCKTVAEEKLEKFSLNTEDQKIINKTAGTSTFLKAVSTFYTNRGAEWNLHNV